jgi:hypothetical protein
MNDPRSTTYSEPRAVWPQASRFVAPLTGHGVGPSRAGGLSVIVLQMAWTRRGILKVGLGGGVLLAVGGLGLSVWPSRSWEPRGALACLSPLEFSIVAAICEAIVPAQEEFPSAWDVRVPELIDQYLALLHPGDQADFKSALALLENGFVGLLLDGRPKPFTVSTVEERTSTLEAWRSSMIPLRRTAFRAIHKVVVATYYAQPEVYPHMGYSIPVGLAAAGAK